MACGKVKSLIYHYVLLPPLFLAGSYRCLPFDGRILCVWLFRTAGVLCKEPPSNSMLSRRARCGQCVHKPGFGHLKKESEGGQFSELRTLQTKRLRSAGLPVQLLVQ